MSVTECARRLADAGDVVERSALSRYCDTHRLKHDRAGRQTLVDFETVRSHRASNYGREVMSGGRQVPPAPPANVVDLDPVKRGKAAKATMEELDLAERLGELTAIAEVDAGAADAVAIMRSAFAGALYDEAEQLAAELSLPAERIRILRNGLKRYGRVGQERFARQIATALADTNEPAGTAYDRLMALAAQAVRLRGQPRREARA